MLPALMAKKVLPFLIKSIANWLYDSFPGIEKIPMLVKYMEEENEADIALKQLADEIDDLKEKVNTLALKDKIATLEEQLGDPE